MMPIKRLRQLCLKVYTRCLHVLYVHSKSKVSKIPSSPYVSTKLKAFLDFHFRYCTKLHLNCKCTFIWRVCLPSLYFHYFIPFLL